MKRLFDIVMSLFALIILFFPFMIIALLIKITSTGPILYWSERVGKNNILFRMPKFRTMLIETPSVATHLLNDPEQYLTPIGSFLRKSSLDEIPQILSIIKGDMSIVGPRPALFNQDDLISQRTSRGVHLLTPGLTGWAQINGRDELPIPVKVDLDSYYYENRSFCLDMAIIVKTILSVVRREGVSH